MLVESMVRHNFRSGTDGIWKICENEMAYVQVYTDTVVTGPKTGI